MHGAGIIEKIEEREVLGELQNYYIMRLPIGDMKVMIPMENAEEIGLRPVIDEEGVAQVLSILQEGQTKMSSNWNRRYRANMEKIKSGDIFAVAEVVRNLAIEITRRDCLPVSARCWRMQSRSLLANWCLPRTFPKRKLSNRFLVFLNKGDVCP